jgi:cytoskeletal protein CcmA (bactofilin family)
MLSIRNSILTLLLTTFTLTGFAQSGKGNKNDNGNQDAGEPRTNKILPHGNVGIGTLTPAEKLEVVGNALISDDLKAKTITAVGFNATNITVSNDLKVGRNILVNGNIGIGIELPQAKLHVKGNVLAEGFTGTDAKFNTITSTTIANSGALNTQDLTVNQLLTGNNLTINGLADFKGDANVSGNLTAAELKGQTLSVNGAAVQEQLQVAGNASFASNLDVTGKIKGSEAEVTNLIFTHGKGNFIAPVGFGTAVVPAGYQMAVNGSIITSTVEVSAYNSWPDYVFTPQYKLSTLAEVEKYIIKSGHLPNIPSAKKIRNNGYSLSEMDAKLLEKIEELTLHAIAQEKVLAKEKELYEQKDKEIKELRDELEKLKMLVKEITAKN